MIKTRSGESERKKELLVEAVANAEWEYQEDRPGQGVQGKGRTRDADDERYVAWGVFDIAAKVGLDLSMTV